MLKIQEILTQSYISSSKLPGYDYVINPYVGCPHGCAYCYAEYMIKHFWAHTEKWGEFVDVKIRSTSHKPLSLAGRTIFISSVTDCYNPLEEKYGITRKILAQLRYSGANITILTKSALVTRDITLLQQIPSLTVGFSISTCSERIRQALEPGASSTGRRIDALKTLHQAGIRTWVNIAPVLPYLTDWKQIIEDTLPYTDHYSFENLKLRGPNLPRMMRYITQQYPDLQESYQQIFERHNMSYWHQLKAEIETFCVAHQLTPTLYFKDK